jgi:hypothetical protein
MVFSTESEWVEQKQYSVFLTVGLVRLHIKILMRMPYNN